MTHPSPCLILLFSCWLSLLLSLSKSETTPPHGPSYNTPTAFSPAAYDFFHPKSQAPAETTTNSPAPLPLSANVEAETQHESKVLPDNHTYGHRVGAGAVVGIFLGLTIIAAFLAMGAYFVMNKRYANFVPNSLRSA